MSHTHVNLRQALLLQEPLQEAILPSPLAPGTGSSILHHSGQYTLFLSSYLHQLWLTLLGKKIDVKLLSTLEYDKSHCTFNGLLRQT